MQIAREAGPAAASSDLQDLVAELRRRVRGEVRFDAVSRALYSTDASIYEIEPLGVVLPRDADDVQAVVEVTRAARAPLLPRGGGTSLAGQTVGRAVVLDFSKYMNAVLEVNAEAGWARVQPGIVRHELLRALAPAGLIYGPETSTSTRATIGGMIGNNSSGSRSIVYGKTVDTVAALRVRLADGTGAVFEDLAPAEAARRAGGDGTGGRLYREVARIVAATRDEVARRFPHVQRRVGGYNLDEFPAGGPVNLSKLIVGSEGTLGIVTEATVRLARRPAATVLAVFQFDDIVPALEYTPEMLATNPTAVELTDRLIIEMARQTRDLSQRLTFVDGDPGAVIAVEYAGETREALIPALDALEARMRRAGYRGAMRRLLEPAAQANLWAVREAGVGLLLGMKAARKPVAFVEDSAVGPERIAEYTRRFREIVRRHGTEASFYGHASVGLLHTRPMLDLRRPRDVAEMRQIAEEIGDLVREFGGALSGEHGDGLSRGEFLEKMFGPVLYRAFREIKAAFDPASRMNPGKIVDAPPMTESLRYRAEEAAPPATIQDFASDGGFRSAIELCSGVGACRKPRGGTMCPSFMVTLDEADSTRGRANALRAAISGRLPGEGLTSRGLYDVMDLCVACKACKAECPSNVDMAKLKHEFLAAYYARHGLPLRARLFGHVAALGPLACAVAPLANWLLGSAPARWTLERAGIDARRRLPAFARRRFTRWWNTRGTASPGPPAAGAAEPGGRFARVPGQGRVALFVDTFTEYYYPEIGRAAVRLLESAGCRVELAPLSCCGRPMLSNGMLRQARALAARTMDRLRPLVAAGVPIVGLEPSCIVTFKDEYPDLVPGDAARSLAQASYAFEEYLAALDAAGVRPLYVPAERRALMHGHCHQKAIIRTGPALAALRAVPGLTVEEIDSGCCGMAGSFGVEREHYDVSLAMGERVLFKAIRAAPGDTLLIASGTSCRQQIAHGTGRRAVHLAEALAQALPAGAAAAAAGG
ncbi:MAG TPA: FAD-linked oxidase C-terminal domain-containing protein [bacterium]|nr:FAD-linked oxidase C-terminal domain-containing protein [bacterium]